eukprot:1538163-Prymnesium_polylepis.2
MARRQARVASVWGVHHGLCCICDKGVLRQIVIVRDPRRPLRFNVSTLQDACAMLQLYARVSVCPAK